MSNHLQVNWRVVLCHKARNQRHMDETEYIVFRAGGAVEKEDLVAPTIHR